jgi:hypothetical protein
VSVERRPIGYGKRVHQHETADFFGMQGGIMADDQAPEGMSDKNVWRGYARLLKERPEFGNQVV